MKSTAILKQSIHAIIVLLCLISCKSKTTSAPPIKEEVLPLPKALEVIHNTVVHSEQHFWKVFEQLGRLTTQEQLPDSLQQIIAATDSLVEIGKARCEASLTTLKKVAEPDQKIGYKQKAKEIINSIKSFYNKDYPKMVKDLQSSDVRKNPEAMGALLAPLWTIRLQRGFFEGAGNEIRKKNNIPLPATTSDSADFREMN
jgi:hypothetical protein